MVRPITSSPLSCLLRIATALCACAVLPSNAAAHPILIDQIHPYSNGDLTIFVTDDVGQTFTPTMARLDAVELWLKDISPTHDVTDTLIVSIFDLGGTLLGSSAPQVIANGYGGRDGALTHFDFAPITLVPNTKYVIGFDVSTTGGFSDLGAAGSYPGTYAGGAYWQWASQTEFLTLDFAFVEGPAAASVPEPASTLMFGVILLGYARRRIRSATSFLFGRVWRVALASSACALLPGIAAAHPIMIDQMQPYTGAANVYLLSEDIGQTFTPTLDRLDAVDLWLMDTGPFNGVIDTLTVRIFELDGTLIGSSGPRDFSDLYGNGVPALTHFDFASIALAPNTKYIIGFDLSTTGVFSDLGIAGYDPGTYTRGGLWRWSTTSESQTIDLAFAEGPAAALAPEPASALLFGVCLLGYAGRRHVTRSR